MDPNSEEYKAVQTMIAAIRKLGFIPGTSDGEPIQDADEFYDRELSQISILRPDIRSYFFGLLKFTHLSHVGELFCEGPVWGPSWDFVIRDNCDIELTRLYLELKDLCKLGLTYAPFYG